MWMYNHFRIWQKLCTFHDKRSLQFQNGDVKRTIKFHDQIQLRNELTENCNYTNTAH